MTHLVTRGRWRQKLGTNHSMHALATRPTLAPSLNVKVDKSGICVHVKTIRLNGPSVILPSADCRLL